LRQIAYIYRFKSEKGGPKNPKFKNAFSNKPWFNFQKEIGLSKKLFRAREWSSSFFLNSIS